MSYSYAERLSLTAFLNALLNGMTMKKMAMKLLSVVFLVIWFYR